jgi:hypothetical protein
MKLPAVNAGSQITWVLANKKVSELQTEQQKLFQ